MSNRSFFSFGDFLTGPQLIEDIHMTKPVTETVDRTWKERLLSWPWKPWMATKLVTYQVPRDDYIVVGGSIVCHPAAAQRLRARLLEAKRGDK